jgi:hypothetical protein
MAVTTVDGALAGMRPREPFMKNGGTMEAIGVLHSMFYHNGRPGVAPTPAPGLAGEALTSYTGQMPWTNPASGNTHLMRFVAASSVAGSLLLLDRLWHNSGFTITTTTAQTVNSVTWPARCVPASGDTPDTLGGNVQVAIEVSSGVGNVSAVTNTTLQYTNQAGVSGRTGIIPSFPATGVAGTFVPFTLQAGDTGIRSIQSLTLGTSYVSGTLHLVAYRMLDMVGLLSPNVAVSNDFLQTGFARLYDNTVPFLVWLPTATTAVNLTGCMVVTQG